MARLVCYCPRCSKLLNMEEMTFCNHCGKLIQSYKEIYTGEFHRV